MDDQNLNDLYEGEPVKVRSKTYIVPGLSFAQLEQHGKVIERITKTKSKSELTPQLMNDITQVIHLSLSRNYPELTLNEIKEMVDTRNAGRFVQAIMGATGMEQPESIAGIQGEITPVV